MSKPIIDEVSIQLYGDGALEDRILGIISDALGTEMVVTNEKDYETKKGASGHYIQAKLKLSDL